jgi:hypothetical protein
MFFARRLKGLLGTALTWGVVGALAGVPVFVAIMRPWPLSLVRWDRFLSLFAKWEGMSALWGVICGLLFGLALLALERKNRLHELTPTRVAAWGAIAGGLFPAALTIRPLLGGANPFYFGGIILASALTGAIWARMSVALARRVPSGPGMVALPLETAVEVSPPRDAVNQYRAHAL